MATDRRAPRVGVGRCDSPAIVWQSWPGVPEGARCGAGGDVEAGCGSSGPGLQASVAGDGLPGDDPVAEREDPSAVSGFRVSEPSGEAGHQGEREGGAVVAEVVGRRHWKSSVHASGGTGSAAGADASGEIACGARQVPSVSAGGGSPIWLVVVWWSRPISQFIREFCR